MGWEAGGRFKRERTYVYLWLIHVDGWQKPAQYHKAIILQLKIDKFFFFFLKEQWWAQGRMGWETRREGDVSQAWKENTARAKSTRLGPCLACGRIVRGPGGHGKGSEWSEKGQSRRRWGQGVDRSFKALQDCRVGPVCYGSYGGYPSFKKKNYLLGCATHDVGSWFPNQVSNPRPPHWRCRVSTTGPRCPPSSGQIKWFRHSITLELGTGAREQTQHFLSVAICQVDHSPLTDPGRQGGGPHQGVMRMPSPKFSAAQPGSSMDTTASLLSR